MENRRRIAYFAGIANAATDPSMHQPLVAISTDVRQFENYTWHAAPQQYLEAAIAGAGVFPVLVPSFGDRLDFDQLLASVEGVMITGSKSNVHPSLYGGEASEENGPYDPARDATTLRQAEAEGDAFRLRSSGGASCAITRGDAVSQDRAELRVETACATLLPGMERAKFWHENDDGAVVFIENDGDPIVSFSVADGVAYESFQPSTPLLSLDAAD
jgi:hypothetical protein